MPARLIIEGGVPLRGEVAASAAKNAALPAMAAALLTARPLTLTNVPDLSDIRTMVALLRALGAEVEIDKAQRRAWVRAAEITSTVAPAELVAKMRASFLRPSSWSSPASMRVSRATSAMPISAA